MEETLMRISDSVANYILEMLDHDNGSAEIQRNELAGMLGCVPSQISYVITSRFTPEQGFLVESRRGGGGYIRITRVRVSRDSAVMQMVQAIGDTVDSITAVRLVNNLLNRGAITRDAAQTMLAALNEKAYICLSPRQRDTVRAAILKNMLLTQIS